MKRIFALISALFFSLSLAACGAAPADGAGQGMSGIMSTEASVSASAPAADTPVPSLPGGPADVGGVIDLTAMGADMVYAYVVSMMAEPEIYMDKAFRVAGQCYASYYEATEQYYHYVVVADAAACCAQGLEFVWDDGARDYPADGTQIEVLGTFGSYEELGVTYYYLDVSELTEK